MKFGGSRRASIFSLLVSAALLVALYRSLDVRLIGEALLKADPLLLVVSVGLILPIGVLRAIRFYWVAPSGALPSLAEAIRLTFVASALNVFAPAKAGDLVKSYFVAKRSDTSAGVAIAIVIYERVCDLVGLFWWCLLGWLLGRPQAAGLPTMFWVSIGVLGALCALLVSSEWVAAALALVVTRVLPGERLRRLRELVAGWPRLLQALRGRRARVVAFSVFLWLTHLFQIWLFTVALFVRIPFTVCASFAALALMVGQIPLTISGVGTRDVALVVLLSPYMPPESAAALGVLVTTRNLLPPLVGIPMMAPYLSSVVGEARRWRSEVEQAR